MCFILRCWLRKVGLVSAGFFPKECFGRLRTPEDLNWERGLLVVPCPRANSQECAKCASFQASCCGRDGRACPLPRIGAGGYQIWLVLRLFCRLPDGAMGTRRFETLFKKTLTPPRLFEKFYAHTETNKANTMRTKTLLLAAVLSAAGAATSLAQVYSVNAVGYVNVNLTAGFNLICNPLKNTAGNQLNNILPLTDADVGTLVYWYSAGAFQSSTYLGTAIGWTPNQAINPGTGIFINVPAAKTVTFVGEVPQGVDSNLAVTPGLSLISSPVPQSLPLNADAPAAHLQFPATVGDLVYFYRGTPKAYQSSTFLGAGLNWVPAAVPAVGEGFWASLTTAGSWTRNFTVN